MASMPAVWTSPGGSSPVRRSTPRTSTPTVCGAACTKRAKTALRNGVAPPTAPVASQLLLERALAGCFGPAANHESCALHRVSVLRWLEDENDKFQDGGLSTNRQGRTTGASRRTRISGWHVCSPDGLA